MCVCLSVVKTVLVGPELGAWGSRGTVNTILVITRLATAVWFYGGVFWSSSVSRLRRAPGVNNFVRSQFCCFSLFNIDFLIKSIKTDQRSFSSKIAEA